MPEVDEKAPPLTPAVAAQTSPAPEPVADPIPSPIVQKEDSGRREIKR